MRLGGRPPAMSREARVQYSAEQINQRADSCGVELPRVHVLRMQYRQAERGLSFYGHGSRTPL